MMRASAMCVPRVLQFVGRGSGRHRGQRGLTTVEMVVALAVDRKSTRLNSSHH